jgi:hypothetical protein
MKPNKPKAPRTPKQIAASRANGKRSHGPISPMGKRISSSNALKHGLHSRFLDTLHPDPTLIANNIGQLTATFHPESPAEHRLIRVMATANAIEHQIHELEAQTFKANGNHMTSFVTSTQLPARASVRPTAPLQLDNPAAAGSILRAASRELAPRYDEALTRCHETFCAAAHSLLKRRKQEKFGTIPGISLQSLENALKPNPRNPSPASTQSHTFPHFLDTVG